MIKFIAKTPERYQRLTKSSLFRKYVFFNLERLDEVKDENLFFRAIYQVRLANGIYKTTKANRFVDVDERLVQLLQPGATYTIHDAAASDGITSVDLYQKLLVAGIVPRLHISDKFAIIYCEKKWYGAIYKDAGGAVLYADFFSIQACRSIISPRFIVSKMLGFLFPEKISLKPTDTEVLMLNPRTRQLINEGKITFSYCDIFDMPAATEQYDIVRCMNVLNHNIFPDEMILKGVNNLVSTIKSEGLFILGRTEDDTGLNRVTVFKKQGNQLLIVTEINGGSEVKQLLKSNKIAV